MKELYNYQEKDIELKKLEKKITNSEFMKKINSSKDLARKNQARMIEINEESKKVLDEIEKINSVKIKGLNLVEKYVQSDINSLNEQSVLEVVNKIKPIDKNLEELISRLTRLEIKMKTLMKDFNECKKQIISSKKIHDENKAKLIELEKEFAGEIERAKKELLAQEKKVDPELIMKYKNAKREGIFPVLVKLDGKNCGYCRVEQAIHKVEKLKLNGFTECEQCHRIIILD